MGGQNRGRMGDKDKKTSRMGETTNRKKEQEKEPEHLQKPKVNQRASLYEMTD